MAATKLFGIRVLNSNKQNPFVTGAQQPTVQGIINFFRGLTSQKAARTVIQTSKDQVAASATLVSNGLTTADVAGASINGVDATATFPGGGTVNGTLTLIKNKINNGGDTQNALISKAVYASRYFADAGGYFLLNGATGSLSPSVGGTSINFTATGDNAVDAATLADAINSNATAGVKVFAYSDGVSRCYIKAAGTNRATVSGISSLAANAQFGCIINGVQIAVAVGTVTMSGTSNGTTGIITINGTNVSFIEGASDSASATAAAAAINSSSVSSSVFAIASSSTLILIANSGLDFHAAVTPSGSSTQTPAFGITTSVTGTGLTSNQTVIVGASGVDATDCLALATLINANSQLSPIVRAVVTSSDTVAVVAKSRDLGVSLSSGTNVTAANGILVFSAASGTVTCVINGISTSITATGTNATDSAAMTAAINSNVNLIGIARAENPSATTVNIFSAQSADQMPAIGAFGTGLTVGGTTTPSTTITVSSASGTMLVYINGVQAVSVVAVSGVGADAANAAALSAAINSSPVARGLVTATVSSNVVTVTSQLGITLRAVGAGMSPLAPTLLTDSGTYGGVAGNSIGLVGATNVTRSGSSLGTPAIATNPGTALGVSGVQVTGSEAGVSGNWITFAAAGAGAAHVTASGARLSGGLETVQNFVYA